MVSLIANKIKTIVIEFYEHFPSFMDGLCILFEKRLTMHYDPGTCVLKILNKKGNNVNTVQDRFVTSSLEQYLS